MVNLYNFAQITVPAMIMSIAGGVLVYGTSKYIFVLISCIANTILQMQLLLIHTFLPTKATTFNTRKRMISLNKQSQKKQREREKRWIMIHVYSVLKSMVSFGCLIELFDGLITFAQITRKRLHYIRGYYRQCQIYAIFILPYYVQFVVNTTSQHQNCPPPSIHLDQNLASSFSFVYGVP